jgi:ribosomal protein S18 acetylase RimI-like enzyme
VKFITIDHWDEELWKKAKVVYEEAFGKSGAKSEKIIRNMFAKGICFLHILFVDDEAVGMAITGKLKNTQALLIDYLAVRIENRKKGIGQKLLDYIKEWSQSEQQLEAIIIEVESERTLENLARIHFWQKNEFQLTDYIHHYIWVPEPYQAMYCMLEPNAKIPLNGEALFQLIIQFHKVSFTIKA